MVIRKGTAMKRRLDKKEALKAINELIKDASLCMLITENEYGKETKPMVTIEVDKEGNIWLFAAQLYQLTADQKLKVQIVYAHPSRDSFMSIKGNVNILYNKDQIEEWWQQIMNTAFPNGVYDIDLCCLARMKIEEAAYWYSKAEKLITIYKADIATEVYDEDILAA